VQWEFRNHLHYTEKKQRRVSAQLMIKRSKKDTNLLPFWTLGSGTSELVVLKPEKLLDRGGTPGALGKKFARGITPPGNCCCSGAEDGAGTCTDPLGLVNEIPGATEFAPRIPFSPDPPFAFAFIAVDPGPIDILCPCWPPSLPIIIDARGGELIIDIDAFGFGFC